MAARRRTTAFTVGISIALALGALLMAVVLYSSGAPQGIAVGAVLAALPVGPLLAAYLWLDRYEPEPRSLLLLGLGWGALVATSIALFVQVIDAFALGSDDITQSIITAPVTEEAAKGLFVLLLLFFRRAELDGVLDGIVYAGMVGIGFAFTENILYLSEAYLGSGDRAGSINEAIVLFVVRGVLSPFAHPFFTAFIGVGIGIAVASRSGVVRVVAPVLGYLLAVGMHAIWNGSLVLDGGSGALGTYVLLMFPAFLGVVGFAFWARRREGVTLARALTDCAQRGFLPHHEVPWLARIPARRAWVRHGRSVGGRAAARRVRAYQSSAIELGFLHSRLLRGTAPANVVALGQSHVDDLNSLRPGLIGPPGAPVGDPVSGVRNR